MNAQKGKTKDTLTDFFFRIFRGKVVIVGIGNILKGDDAFGPALIEALGECPGCVLIDAGTSPENYAGKIVKENPDTVLLADAAHLDLDPGSYEILRKDDIARSGFTTHDQSPDMFINYLQGETSADVYMLAVQPGSVSFGEDMSASVKGAIDEITGIIKSLISNAEV